VLAANPKLLAVASMSITPDAIDVAEATRRGIPVTVIPPVVHEATADIAFGLMLAVAKRASFQTTELRAGRWTRWDNVYLQGKTLGVVGTGNIGAHMARLARAIGMEVLAWTFHPGPERQAALGLRYVPLDELLGTADVVSLHLKLTPESRGLIGARELALMKPGAILVNTARGAVVDTDALVAALHSGHLGGAALDVSDPEPLPPGHPLLGCAQVVLTPHSADQTPEGMELLNTGVVDNVIAFLEGRPQNVVA